jgi:hypothetical protein
MKAVGGQASSDKAEAKTQPHGQPHSQVQVIARAAAILRALEDEAAGLSLGQIAQRVNLPRRPAGCGLDRPSCGSPHRPAPTSSPWRGRI